MRLFITIVFFLITTALHAETGSECKPELGPYEILQKISDKLSVCRTISYNYYRSINYFSENYHNETSGTAFFDFKVSDTTLGFRYQLDNEHYKMVYNGAESFYLNKTEKKIKINYKPKPKDFASISFFLNSIVTLKRAIPIIIANAEIVKKLTDTTINNRNYYLISVVLQSKTMDGLGTFSATTLKRDFVYRIIIDKKTFLPLHIIQTNNAEPKDYMLTSFSNIVLNDSGPSDLSWYYSTYISDFKLAAENALVLIKPNTAAPDWELPGFHSNEVRSLSSLKGKVVLLEFWIKNCGYCIAAVPRLNALIEKYNSKKLEVIGINMHDSKEDISSFYQRNNPRFMTVYDKKKITTDYGVEAFPTVVLIDEKGVVLYSGHYDQDQLDKLITDALN